MEEIQYIGEHLFVGGLGHFALLMGFTASLLATVAYFMATQRRNLPEFEGWRRIGRVAFGLHGLGVFAVMASILYLMINQCFEYQYVQLHVSEELDFRYVFSAFWEGQEGSFLLWMFWHAVLGMILMWKAKEWETPVLTILALVQAVLFSMILGVYIGEVKIGSNPLLLLRDTMDIPLFNNADYVSLLKGNGLNPLLQNYWMTIHPPTLFLGFASTVVPFCYAIAGLWTKQHKAWLKPVLPWALFSGSILGTGILMGGAWAYEALTFGGYWAWDPVENMSLVPWIVLIAGIHTNLIARNTNYSIKSTYLFYLLSFLLIVYSTFLTRSGVLGESSVHAFTEMGLESQLIAFIVGFGLLAFILLIARNKGIPTQEKEEPTPSKEFWMFIGTLVLLFSAAMITASTSLPVYNKIREVFDPMFEGLTITEPVEHYNKYQLWIGVFIGLLSGMAQYLRYKEFNWKGQLPKFGKHTLYATLISVALTFISTYWINAHAWQYWLLLFSAWFAVISNLDYLFTFLKGNLKLGASVFAHVGFGLMIIGVLASGLNKEHISTNPVVQRGLLEEDMLERNVLLFKGMPMFMSGYEVTYEKDTIIGKERYFTVNYKKIGENGEIEEEFEVKPSALYDNKGLKVAAYNPSTKHYPHKDIFTHIATLPLREADREAAHNYEDTLSYQTYPFSIGKPITIRDTVRTQMGPQVLTTQATLLGIDRDPSHPDYEPEEGDRAFGVRMAFQKKDTFFYAEPVLVLRQSLLYTYPVQLNDLSFKVRLTDAILDPLFTPEEMLEYQTFAFEEGEEIHYNGLKITFTGFNKTPTHPSYEKEEGDIAVGAIFEVQDPNLSGAYSSEPVYLIRGRTPFNFKSEIPEMGLHIRFTGIDPNTGSIEAGIAKKEGSDVFPIEIAKKSLRTDYIVLEAIVFPGINLFWLGSVLMMFGLGFGMFRRRKMNS